MIKEKIGIVIPFYNTPMWGQVAVWSLIQNIKDQKLSDRYDIRIIVIDNMDEEGPRSNKKITIRAISDVPEFKEFVTVVKNPLRIKGHGMALDIGLKAMPDIDYLLCSETDIIVKDDWLDWLMLHLDSKTWMAGFEFIAESGTRNVLSWYVMPNPGIYRADILRLIDEEVRNNKENMYYFGDAFTKTWSPAPASDIDQYGAFSELRGFKQLSEHNPDGKGAHIRPTPGHYENGQWLFFRVLAEDSGYQFRGLDCKNEYAVYSNGVSARSQTVFGDGKIIHYWAGTRSYDFMTHPEMNQNQINYVRQKIDLEVNVWKQVVPFEIRKIVPEIYNECRNDKAEIENILFLYNEEGVSPQTKALSKEIADWYKLNFLDTDFMGIL